MHVVRRTRIPPDDATVDLSETAMRAEILFQPRLELFWRGTQNWH